MLTKNINSIFLSKATLVFKMVLFLLIIVLIFSVIAFSIIMPVSKGLRADIEQVGLGYKFASYVEATLTNTNPEEARVELLDAIYKIDDIMANWNGAVIGAIVTFVILAILYGIVYFMSYYTISDILNNFMSSNSKYGFAANFIANAKKSFIFSIWYTLYVIGVYVVGFGVAIGIGLLIGRWSASIGLFVMYLLAIGTLATRRAVTPFWMPAMVAKDLSCKDAFYKNFELLKGRFWKTYGAYFMLYLLAVVLFLGSSILTFGVAMIFAFCAVWLYFQIRDMVAFYHINGMKYYIDEQTVIDPKKIYRDAVLDEENFKL
ncbi:MAG: hypothetical protein E7338_04740 [Clostridiales bacterium]|nr:hypothetical protein [Clostridiales bacterium]